MTTQKIINQMVRERIFDYHGVMPNIISGIAAVIALALILYTCGVWPWG